MGNHVFTAADRNALRLVLQLAAENALPVDAGLEPDLQEEAERQADAIARVREMLNAR